MTKKPYENSELAAYISKRVLELRGRKTQAEIAVQAGYVSQNMLSMIKQGSSKVALDRVPALARALECDPAYLMRLALEQAVGETAALAILEIFGSPVTANEIGWGRCIMQVNRSCTPMATSSKATQSSPRMAPNK